GQEYRCLRLPLRRRSPTTDGDLYIFYPESLRRTAVRDATRPLVILGGLGGLLAVGLAGLIGARLGRRGGGAGALPPPGPPAGDSRAPHLPGRDAAMRDVGRSGNDRARRLAEFQDEQQRSERLRLLGQFSGGLAHQLRNAAAGAKLAVELFLAENPSADPEP